MEKFLDILDKMQALGVEMVLTPGFEQLRKERPEVTKAFFEASEMLADVAHALGGPATCRYS
jgi:predicted metal-dependent TIM-barrel fold hydrolase